MYEDIGMDKLTGNAALVAIPGAQEGLEPLLEWEGVTLEDRPIDDRPARLDRVNLVSTNNDSPTGLPLGNEVVGCRLQLERLENGDRRVLKVCWHKAEGMGFEPT